VTATRVGGGIKVIGGESMEELHAMNPHEFARLMIVQKLNGTVSPQKTGDMGIDGWIEFKTVPVQVKQSEVSRPVIDGFKTAIQRVDRKKGIVIGFSFSKGAIAEAERLHLQEGLKIDLVTVEEICAKKA